MLPDCMVRLKRLQWRPDQETAKTGGQDTALKGPGGHESEDGSIDARMSNGFRS